MIGKVDDESHRSLTHTQHVTRKGTGNMHVQYLTGEHLYLRALELEDKEQAAAWFDSPFPVTAARAEAYLREQHNATPWNAQRHHLALCRSGSEEIVGGANVRIADGRSHIAIYIAPWLDGACELRAEALRLLVNWLREDHELMAITVSIAADDERTIAAAEELGMSERVRLRGFLTRQGARVDLLQYQLGNPWRKTFADA